jgi:hypothetical protein
MKDSPENSAVIFIRGGETGPMRYCWLMPSELEHQAFTSYPLYEPSHLTITRDYSQHSVGKVAIGVEVSLAYNGKIVGYSQSISLRL